MRNVLCVTQLFPPLPEVQAICSYRLLSAFHKYDFWPIIYYEEPLNWFLKLDYSILDSNTNNYETHSISSLFKFKIFRKICAIFPMLQIPDQFVGGRWGFLSWNLGVCLQNIFLSKKNINLIFSISTPVSDHITGLFLKMWTNLPWVVLFSDPWVNNPALKENYYHNLHKWLQKKVIEKADFLIFTTKETRDFVLGQYPLDYRSKSFVIPHSFYPNFESVLPNKSSPDRKVIFRYTGIFTSARTPEPLMAGISIAKGKVKDIESHFQFEFIGRPFSGIKELRKKYKIGKELIEVPPVTYLESLNYMKGADVLVNLEMDLKVNLFLPLKLIEYIGARRPIFGITPRIGTSANLIKQAKGFLAEPNRPEEIADCIIEIVKKKQKKELEYHIPDQDVVDRYKIENVAREYVKVFKKAISL